MRAYSVFLEIQKQTKMAATIPCSACSGWFQPARPHFKKCETCARKNKTCVSCGNTFTAAKAHYSMCRGCNSGFRGGMPAAAPVAPMASVPKHRSPKEEMKAITTHKGAGFVVTNDYNRRDGTSLVPCAILGQETGGMYRESYNIFSGKREGGDCNAYETAKRELYEESGMRVTNVDAYGIFGLGRNSIVGKMTVRPGWSRSRDFNNQDGEMSRADQIPIANIKAAVKVSDKAYVCNNIDGRQVNVSSFAYEVVCAMC